MTGPTRRDHEDGPPSTARPAEAPRQGHGGVPAARFRPAGGARLLLVVGSLLGSSASPLIAAAPAIASTVAASTSTAVAATVRLATDVEDVIPRLERQSFAGALNAAALDRVERDLLLALFDDYEVTLEQLARDLEDRRIEAGRDRYDDAIAGRIRLSPDELRALRRDIAIADLESWRPASLAIGDLLEICRFSLDGSSAERLAAELPGLRRSAYLDALAGGEDPRLQAGEAVDLERLMIAGAREELAGVPGGSVEAVLAAWSAAIDPILPATAGEIRAARIERRIARTAGDLAAVEDADGRLVAAWARLHGPLTAAVDRVAELAREADGEAAAAAWRDRVRQAAFPWLHAASRRPELAADWVARNVGGTAATEARGLADRWVRDRAECDDETVALVLEARRDHRRIVHPRSRLGLLGGGRPAEIFRELLKVSGRAEQIDREAEDAIAALLDPADRGRMRSALRALMLRRR